MKKFIPFIFMVLASSVGSADSTVSTHAYVFPSDDDVKPLQIHVVLEQPGTVRFLICSQPGGTSIPHSTTELNALLASACELDVGFADSDQGTAGAERIFHQKDSDRYVKLDTTIIWDATGQHTGKMDLGSYSRNLILDNKSKGTLNILYTFQDTEDGKNPIVSTYRTTKFNAYDTEFQYPVIVEKPIEQ